MSDDYPYTDRMPQTKEEREQYKRRGQGYWIKEQGTITDLEKMRPYLEEWVEDGEYRPYAKDFYRECYNCQGGRCMGCVSRDPHHDCNDEPKCPICDGLGFDAIITPEILGQLLAPSTDGDRGK